MKKRETLGLILNNTYNYKINKKISSFQFSYIIRHSSKDYSVGYLISRIIKAKFIFVSFYKCGYYSSSPYFNLPLVPFFMGVL